MTDDARLQPSPFAKSDNTGIYLDTHGHEWRLIGARLWPIGVWHPVFVCTVCTDVICDLHQPYPGAPEGRQFGSDDRVRPRDPRPFLKGST